MPLFSDFQATLVGVIARILPIKHARLALRMAQGRRFLSGWHDHSGQTPGAAWAGRACFRPSSSYASITTQPMSTPVNRNVRAEVAKAIKADYTCAALRELCRQYNEDELHEALASVSESRSPFLVDYQDAIKQAIDRLRHKQVEEHFDKLKKPHWTLVPTFWLVLTGAIAGVVAATMAVISWKDSAELKSASQSLSNQSLPSSRISAPSNQKAPSTPVAPTTNSVVVPASPKN